MNQYFRSLVVGVDIPIPLCDGKWSKAIHFDNAATTPPLLTVMNEIVRFAPWYSSIHRGAGYKSLLSSNIYEQCRWIVADFVNADIEENAIIFVKNTTEAINKLSYRLYEEGKKRVVLSTFMEHHSNDLPWRDKYHVDYVKTDSYGRLSMEDLEEKLKKYAGSLALVAVTGASNVTGYKNPIYQIARLAHRYGAKILVDGAQLIPHAPFDMKPMDSPEHIDYLAFSGHKMYAPFGAGVLIGPKSTFERSAPEYRGGGTVEMVTHDFIRWAEPPLKEEAGTPNIMGAVALAAAIKSLNWIGMERIESNERLLLHHAIRALKNMPDIKLYHDGNEQDSVGILSFNILGIPHQMVAQILSYEGGIAVRSGCFCAQPYIQKLLGLSSKEIQRRIQAPKTDHPGMVRISFGLYNTMEEVEKFVDLLYHIIKNKSGYLKKYQHLLPDDIKP